MFRTEETQMESAILPMASTMVGDVEVSTTDLTVAGIGVETMLFGGPDDQELWRMETREQGYVMHEIVVDTLRAGGRASDVPVIA